MPDADFDSSNAPIHDREAPARRQFWLEFALILLVFYLNSGWPVPDNNEAHYLGKARHFWDPTFCAGDAFFRSAHTHQVFYVLIGWWTLILPLPAVAWIGRLLTWSLLAVGWRRLSWRIVPRPFWSVFSAALLVALQERCQVAGEWLIGGFEAKGIAYALVFFGLDAALAGRWRTVWLWLGAASAWHVLVGGWAVIALLPAWWWERRQGRAPSFRELIPALTIGLLISMPAIISALRLTLDASASVVAEANRIYVFERLPHHLNPAVFPPRGVTILVMLLVATGLLSRATPSTVATRTVWRFALASAGISLIGWAIALALAAWPDQAAGLLKYYWFRLADVAIPLGASLAAIAYLNYALRSAPLWGRAWMTAALCFVVFHLADFGIQTQTIAYPRADKPGKVVDHEVWKETCQWIAKNTPPGSRFITPRQNQTFKWYAERAEVATWKDIPQDAEAIVRWHEKLEDLYGDPEDDWYAKMATKSWNELCEFGREMGADYIVLDYSAAHAIFYDNPANSDIAVTAEYEHTLGPYSVYKLSPDRVWWPRPQRSEADDSEDDSSDALN